MSKTYAAILHGDRVEWQGEAPPHTEQPVRVDVVVSTDPGRRSNGQMMADALEKLAELGAFSGIKDPVAWQREIRRDRPLPGRD